MAGAPLLSNGDSNHAPLPNGTSHGVSELVEALEAVYSPQSSNEIRQQASLYLSNARQTPEAPALGFSIANDKSRSPALRLYGLSMLEYPIRYAWDRDRYSEEQETRLRQSIVQLAETTDNQDPQYVRNKVGQLWTELAKRSWGVSWLDMDELLVKLWSMSLPHQELVLYVLETLAEDVFTKEDTAAGLRSLDLSRAYIEIFVPAHIFAKLFPDRDQREQFAELRCGNEGWMKRLCDSLTWCLENTASLGERVQTHAIKILSALKATFPWVNPKAIVETECISRIGQVLTVNAAPLQMAAVEALCLLYCRSNLQDEDVVELVTPMFENITLFRTVFESCDIDINELDDVKYTLCKKLSDLLALIGGFLEQRPHLLGPRCDLPTLLSLFLDVMKSQSLVVSIPALHVWTKLLRSRTVRDSEIISPMVGALLEVSSQRLVRYEAFPEDSTDPTYLFLQEDFDTMPERHAFLGNYRRYCTEIVEIVVRKLPFEAMDHILSQATSLFNNLYAGVETLNPRTFSKNSPPVLRADAQVTVIDAALKGYLKWISSHGHNPDEDEQARIKLLDAFEQWAKSIMMFRFEDPEIKKKVIQLQVTFATKALRERPTFAVTVLDFLLDISCEEDPNYPVYSESVRALYHTSQKEMQRLAMYFPDQFMAIFDELERKIQTICSTRAFDKTQRPGYDAFLFIIIHRSSTVDKDTQIARLQHSINAVKSTWANPELKQSITSFETFCVALGLDQVPQYLSSRGFAKAEDWSEQQLDEEGRTLQSNITNRVAQLPFRLTKSLLSASTEKMEPTSDEYEMASAIWADAIPTILPSLLQLTSLAQSYNDRQNWSHLPEELQAVMSRVLVDRFWQAGISSESKDDFYARVSTSKSTFEGLASTIRGSVRQVREACYWIICGLSYFRDFFYGIVDLPLPLSEALYTNAAALSSHHCSVLLQMSTQLIEGCPPHLRNHFLPHIVAGLFTQLDKKITSEWAMINQRISEANEGDNLGDEMKTESILRSLTYSAANLLSVLLDQHRTDFRKDGDVPKDQLMWMVILSNSTTLESTLLFCKNAIGMRDTRSCTLIIRILRNTIPIFRKKDAVRDFFCLDILQAAITSLHEPYFVDAQKDLAGLIAHITTLDDEIPRTVILSLPGMQEKQQKVDSVLKKLAANSSERTARALVLDLLQSVRGVSIHEQGKISTGPKVSDGAAATRRPAMLDRYMAVDEQPAIVRGGSPGLEGLEGVADMFQ